MYGPIRTQIKSVIDSMQNSPIKEVCRVEKSSFSGYPAVTISPSESQGDYHETRVDSARRNYVFTIRAYYPFVEGEEKADLELEKVVDALLELFLDKSILSPTVDWVAPAPSVWGYAPKGDGLHRTAEIKLSIIKYF